MPPALRSTATEHRQCRAERERAHRKKSSKVGESDAFASLRKSFDTFCVVSCMRQIPPHRVSVHLYCVLCESYSTCSQQLTIAQNLCRFIHWISRLLLLPVTPLFSVAYGPLIMVVSGAHSKGQHAEPQQVLHMDVCDISIDSQGKPFMT